MMGPEICGVCWALKFLRAVGARSGHAGQRAVPHDGQQVALQHFVCAVSGGAGRVVCASCSFAAVIWRFHFSC